MGEFVFDCLDVRPERYAAAPTLNFRLRIAETTGLSVQAISLRCQIRIQPQRRHYSPSQQERLYDLFGEHSRWGDTLKPFQFVTVPTMVPAFRGSTEIDLPVPCTYDLEVASAQYFHALDDGEIPLLMLFSGTVFARGEDGGLAVEQVPWHKECTYRLPVRVWRELMDTYFPNSAWLRLSRDTVDALGRFKSRNALPTWDDTLVALLKQAGEAEPE
ncbi:MAG: hypothetical protein GEV03_14055 [Streptosporangiales bacterium]|nr:hypothetical protein [Streptosporangiales bacterium]